MVRLRIANPFYAGSSPVTYSKPRGPLSVSIGGNCLNHKRHGALDQPQGLLEAS